MILALFYCNQHIVDPFLHYPLLQNLHLGKSLREFERDLSVVSANQTSFSYIIMIYSMLSTWYTKIEGIEGNSYKKKISIYLNAF